jgi:hypothetical protein
VSNEGTGRLKFNGRLVVCSPLSRLKEIETLSLGVESKLGLRIAIAHMRLAEIPRRRRRDQGNAEADAWTLAAPMRGAPLRRPGRAV